MPDMPLLAVDVRCLSCRRSILRTEVDPGDEIEIPEHECGA